MVYNTVLTTQAFVGSSPNLYQCFLIHLQVHGPKRLGYNADFHTVSRCHTRGEFEDHTGEKACKGCHGSRDDQGMQMLPTPEVQNRGISGPKKGLMSSKTFF